MYGIEFTLGSIDRKRTGFVIIYMGQCGFHVASEEEDVCVGESEW